MHLPFSPASYFFRFLPSTIAMLSLAGFVGCKDDNKERNTVATPPDADALVAETTAPNEPAAATAPNTQVDATVPSGLTVADIASLRMA